MAGSCHPGAGAGDPTKVTSSTLTKDWDGHKAFVRRLLDVGGESKAGSALF